MSWPLNANGTPRMIEIDRMERLSCCGAPPGASDDWRFMARQLEAEDREREKECQRKREREEREKKEREDWERQCVKIVKEQEMPWVRVDFKPMIDFGLGVDFEPKSWKSKRKSWESEPFSCEAEPTPWESIVPTHEPFDVTQVIFETPSQSFESGWDKIHRHSYPELHDDVEFGATYWQRDLVTGKRLIFGRYEIDLDP